jgi:hypothetical protein
MHVKTEIKSQSKSLDFCNHRIGLGYIRQDGGESPAVVGITSVVNYFTAGRCGVTNQRLRLDFLRNTLYTHITAALAPNSATIAKDIESRLLIISVHSL